MSLFLRYILAFIIVVGIAINFTVYFSVKMLCQPELLFEQVPSISDRKFKKAFHKLNELGESLYFSHEAFFLFHGIIFGPPLLCASWINPQEKTRMLVYLGSGMRNVDFVTKYSDISSLTTASTSDALLLPYPPSYHVQAFTGIGVHAQYYRHQEARQLIEKTLTVNPIHQNQDVVIEASVALRKQAHHIMGLPYWYLRGIYWFIRKNNIVNRKIIV